MIKKISFCATIALTALTICLAIGVTPAAACNRTAGCAMDSFLENYDMMHSDKMAKAMAAGQDNIEAFKRLRDAEQRSASPNYVK